METPQHVPRGKGRLHKVWRGTRWLNHSAAARVEARRCWLRGVPYSCVHLRRAVINGPAIRLAAIATDAASPLKLRADRALRTVMCDAHTAFVS